MNKKSNPISHDDLYVHFAWADSWWRRYWCDKNKELMRKLTAGISTLLLIFSLVLAVAAVRPQQLAAPLTSSSHIRLQEEGEEVDAADARSCSYTVKIKTSCSSTRFTRDKISLVFGDAYRNEVYAVRLDDPSSAVFERCSTDAFKIQGPCGYGICYLYLWREGWDGWTPESVKVYEPYASRAVTFYYGTPLPNAAWYGFNHCPRTAAVDASATS